MIGDDPAPTFFSISTGFTGVNTAQVQVRSNLANGNQDRYYVSTAYSEILL